MTKTRAIVFVLVATVAVFWMAQAGNLEPPGPPAPTMKTLGEIPGSWHRVMSSGRFQIVMGGAGVLDHETGLVWQREPALLAQEEWTQAIRDCLFAEIGGRKGWRLPAAEELATLVDMSQSMPTLPAGHPFVNIASDDKFWTRTTSPWVISGSPDLNRAFLVDFETGIIYSEKKVVDSTFDWIKVWCVRGGAGYDWTGQF